MLTCNLEKIIRFSELNLAGQAEQAMSEYQKMSRKSLLEAFNSTLLNVL